jgi:threonine dehydratase
MTAIRPLVTLDDVHAAKRVIAPHVRRTPMLRSDQLSDRLGVDLNFKLELFQKTVLVGSNSAR